MTRGGFAQAWNLIIDGMREGDLISNRERKLLSFRTWQARTTAAIATAATISTTTTATTNSIITRHHHDRAKNFPATRTCPSSSPRAS